MIQNCDIDSKLVVAIHFSHFDPGHTALMSNPNILALSEVREVVTIKGTSYCGLASTLTNYWTSNMN